MSNDIQEAESNYSAATKAELARNYDVALRLYIKSAEIFLHLSRANEKDKPKWKARAGLALERAEKVKDYARAYTSKQARTSTAVAVAAVGVDRFSSREQSYVLHKSSTVNDELYALWDDPRSTSTDIGSLPSLSPEQEKHGALWRRPQVASSPNIQCRSRDILQHTVTDCSVCASISLCMEHAERFGSSLLEDSVHYDPQTGRCDVKLHVNGGQRRIAINDELPHDPTNNDLLCMTCRPPDSDLPLAWPSLLEKAYMKLMGGYDFPGSNSCIDLHALVGWIPEQIEIRSGFERERTWNRLHVGFQTGQCLFTLGTGPQSTIKWGCTRLLTSHSYAVIDVLDDGNDRSLTILDSWTPSDARDEQSRILKIPWSDVVAIFDTICISWDPELWKTHIDLHCQWEKREGTTGSTCDLRARFSFREDAGDGAVVWILLTRHLSDTQDPSHFIALNVVAQDDSPLTAAPPIAIREDREGAYTNSPHILIKRRIYRDHPEGILNILASYDGPSKDPRFTLTIYTPNTVSVDWETAFVRPPFASVLEDKLTQKTAGGNPEYSTFMLNPQYLVRIPATTARGKVELSLTLETEKDLPVNVLLAWSKGERIFDLSEKDLVASSGPYRYGLARLIIALNPGIYVAVVSAFEPFRTGSFTLSGLCSSKFEMTKMLQEGSGMYSKVVKGSWTSTTAMGGPSFQQYFRNPIFVMDCPAPNTQVKVRLQLLKPRAGCPLNVAVFRMGSADKLATSGAYDDAGSGVVTPGVTLAKGKYWIIPSMYSPGVQADFQLIVYTSGLETTIVPKESI
ncbi:cysteine proteinase [Cylindrobasidium torrendii FP15055 ss-10]|uniref:Cysteine proteinase n=1 Tax=Cylindrobasidium torrendii FP15055 ss-10 TaxID=1314674 RepID=A0A0D7BH39_9AGAR|nr:cysteine proteinase [Cylindrobasidium torrendii FP15055 ss-10]